MPWSCRPTSGTGSGSPSRRSPGGSGAVPGANRLPLGIEYVPFGVHLDPQQLAAQVVGVRERPLGVVGLAGRRARRSGRGAVDRTGWCRRPSTGTGCRASKSMSPPTWQQIPRSPRRPGRRPRCQVQGPVGRSTNRESRVTPGAPSAARASSRGDEPVRGEPWGRSRRPAGPPRRSCRPGMVARDRGVAGGVGEPQRPVPACAARCGRAAPRSTSARRPRARPWRASPVEGPLGVPATPAAQRMPPRMWVRKRAR
jgi:hypothetical protein